MDNYKKGPSASISPPPRSRPDSPSPPPRGRRVSRSPSPHSEADVSI